MWWYTVTQTALANKMHAGLTAADKEKAALANKLGEEKAALSARWQQQLCAAEEEKASLCTRLAEEKVS